MRVPTVVRWPGETKPGQNNDELMTTMDLLPTLAKLAGATLPSDRVIDGKNIWPALLGQAKSPHAAFFYFKRDKLEAVRSGKWKLRVNGNHATELHDLSSDIGEKKNVLRANPLVVKRMLRQTRLFKAGLAKNTRPAGFVRTATPLTKK